MLRSTLLLAAVALVAATLRTGEALPAIHGETLSGKPVDVPDAAAGGPQILIFSFARAASTDSRAWSDRLAKDLPRIGAFRVLELESVPRLVRGMARSGMKSGMPKPLWDRTVLIYKDEALWKARLGVTADTHSYVLLLDAAGRVLWRSSGPFSDTEYHQLKTAVQAVSALSSPVLGADG